MSCEILLDTHLGVFSLATGSFVHQWLGRIPETAQTRVQCNSLSLSVDPLPGLCLLEVPNATPHTLR